MTAIIGFMFGSTRMSPAASFSKQSMGTVPETNAAASFAWSPSKSQSQVFEVSSPRHFDLTPSRSRHLSRGRGSSRKCPACPRSRCSETPQHEPFRVHQSWLSLVSHRLSQVHHGASALDALALFYRNGKDFNILTSCRCPGQKA